MEQSRRDDYDVDACLEHSEEDLHESFVEFYHDVLPEFKSVGKVVQFKVRGQRFPLSAHGVFLQLLLLSNVTTIGVGGGSPKDPAQNMFNL